MHRAKVEGKSEIKIFDQNMHKQALKLLHMDSDLRKALDNREFLVFYQPIIILNNLELAGFEALIRWKHPEKGLVSPGEFIPVAEDTELIMPIGEWVLEQACYQTRKWQTKYDRDDLYISVNLSAKQFKQGNLPDKITNTMNASGLPHSSLQLEITESVIMENARASIRMLEQLQSCGPKISIDDFGTGYSSLSYLQRFPIDSLKIDRSFVFTLDQGADNYEFVKTIRTLASNLDLAVVAEGVENQEQLAMLQKLKCEFAQGYYFAKPMDAEAAEKFLSDPLPWLAASSTQEGY
jgi:EAL domain-containing protein (putative c-di-GMP-specific phosphodiesterase class I)